MKKRHCLIASFCAATMLNALDIPNYSFEEGQGKAVAHWTLTDYASGGVVNQGSEPPKPVAGAYAQASGSITAPTSHGKRAIFIQGDGKSNHYWLSEVIPFKPLQTYKLTYRTKALQGTTGCIITGPVFANFDESFKEGDWCTNNVIFTVPQNRPQEDYKLRFGQWYATGCVIFDDVKVIPVQPVYQSVDGITLGDGEKVSINEYDCTLAFTAEGKNHARPLVYASASFNSNRWVFGQGCEVIYRHDVGTRKQLGATLNATVNYHVGGKLVAYASRDQKNWLPIGELAATGDLKATLPQKLFPAQQIFIRLVAANAQKVGAKDSDPGSFQINRYNYKATLEGAPISISGTTAYMEVDNKRTDLDLQLLSIDDCLPGRVNYLTTKVTNTGDKTITLKPQATGTQLTNAANSPVAQDPQVSLPPKTTKLVRIPFRVGETGTWTINASLTDQTTITFKAIIPHYLASGYGQMISQTPEIAAVWTASSGWKVNPTRPLPTEKTNQITLAMAANEAEATQIIVTPEKDLTGLELKASALTGTNGVTIPAANVDLLYVYYHDVQIKTDYTGFIGKWPDALPPITKPLNLKAKVHQPFWLRVFTPKGTPAGFYRGTVTLKDTNGWTCKVPVQVQVFNFTLPDEMTCETGFGFSPHNVWKYHKPKTEQQRRELVDKYLENYAKHHISLYNPTPLDAFTYRLVLKDQENMPWEGTYTYDKADKAEGEAALFLKDDNKKLNIYAQYPNEFPCPPQGVTVSLAYKASQGHVALFTLSHQDASRKWLYGKNIDRRLVGTGNWQKVTIKCPPHPQNAKTFAFSLRPTSWTDAGELTGEVRFDQITITDNQTGKVIFKENFKPIAIQDHEIKFEWDRWDKAMARAYEKYRFNCFCLPVAGLGGGTYHSRREPTFMGFAENTPEYKYLHKNYLAQLQKHLQEKGWLEKAYVYWFDEPTPKDYDFVMNGFRKLKEGAPLIRRLLTEQVEPELIGGPNLWCSITSNLALSTIKPRQDAGDQVWWYVCTAPKAPYATLFIDHPGTEMRVWLWQTWKHGVTGILVWATNYWTSNAAYPEANKPQNPYLDPMGWVSGYATKAGSRLPWGNGDGRFVYPPLAAADANPDQPVMEGPVDSFRIEMLRDGIEDYEYFVILRDLIQKNPRKLPQEQLDHYRKLLEVPLDVTESMTVFTNAPEPMERHRMKLAKAIEELSK